jgi:hypothetical protein
MAILKSIAWLAVYILALGVSAVVVERITGSTTVRDIWMYSSVFGVIVWFGLRIWQRSKQKPAPRVNRFKS